MIHFLIYCLSLSFIIFIWLKTNAFFDFLGWIFVEYKLIKAEEYSQAPEVVRNSLFYPLWLYVNYPSFLTKLLSCPLCLSFWSSIIFINWGLHFWFAGAFITLVMFSLLDKLYKHGE